MHKDCLGNSPSLLFFPILVSDPSLVSSFSPLELRLSVEALVAWSLLELDAGECMVDRPRRSVLNRVTKDVLFLKLERRESCQER